MLSQNVRYHYKSLCVNRNKTLKVKENYSTEMCTSVFFGGLLQTPKNRQTTQQHRRHNTETQVINKFWKQAINF